MFFEIIWDDNTSAFNLKIVAALKSKQNELTIKIHSLAKRFSETIKHLKLSMVEYEIRTIRIIRIEYEFHIRMHSNHSNMRFE